jgi:hypothetical protein
MLLRSLLSVSLLAITFGTTLHAGPVFYTVAFKTTPSPGVFGTIDPSTGVVTPIGGATLVQTHDIALSPSGVVYSIEDTNLVTIDKLTGTPTTVGTLPTGLQSLAFGADGALFGVTDTTLYSLNPATAGGTPIGLLGIGAGLDNLRFDGSGGLFIMTAETDSRLFSVNQSTGAATLIGASGQDDISLGAFYGGVFIGTNAGGGGPQLVTVSPFTGLGTAGAPTDNIYLIALDPTSVPEPSTFALFGVTALVVAMGKLRLAS